MDDLNLNTPQLEDNDDFDAAQALLDRWVKKDPPKAASEKPDPEEDADDANEETDGDEGDDEQDEAADGDDQDQEDPQEADGDEDGEDEGEKPEKITYADETAKVKITVDGAEHEVSVKDLKRLWGQEASLTRKSQEVAQQTKVVTERRSQYETALNAMYQTAVERAKPYAQIDFALAAKNLSPEDYSALKKDAQDALGQVKYFEEELKGHYEKVTKEAEAQHKEAAAEAVKALTTEDSPTHIPGWDDKLYHELVDYGVKMGIPQEQMLQSTSAPSFKILWMAMQFEKSKNVATQKKTKVAGKKPLTGKGPKSRDADRPAHAMSRLKKSGSVEDAAMTLFERWGTAD